MERRIKRVKKKSRWKKIVVIVAVLLLSIVAVLYMVSNVKVIEYVGNNHYEEQKLTKLIFGTESPNSIYFQLFENKDKTIPFIEKYDIDIEWPDKMYVTVYEKSIIGYIKYMGCNMYFDREGIVVESTSEYYEGVPQITGLQFDSIVLNSKLEIGDDKIFDEILELTQLFETHRLDIDKVHYDSSYDVSLYMGDVIVKIGDASDCNEKIYKLHEISSDPKVNFSSFKGTLYLSDYDGTNNSIYFK